MKVDENMIDKIAKLSMLEFDEKQKPTIINDMNKMLEFINKLNEINTNSIEPLIHISEEKNILRKDISNTYISQKEALKNAPMKDSTYFKIPKVLDK